MERKFEEKFGLKTEEMEKILGGVVAPVDVSVSCESSCMIVCSACVLCSCTCTFSK